MRKVGFCVALIQLFLTPPTAPIKCQYNKVVRLLLSFLDYFSNLVVLSVEIVHGRFIATSATQRGLLSTIVAFTTPSRNKNVHALAIPRLPRLLLCQRNTKKFTYFHAQSVQYIVHYSYTCLHKCITYHFFHLLGKALSL